MQARFLRAPCGSGLRLRTRQASRLSVAPRAQGVPGVPDYTQPGVPGQKNRRGLLDGHMGSIDGGSGSTRARQWWDYAAPSASVGQPDIEIKPVGIPQVSPDGGDGNGGGGGGGGGRGGGGNGGGSGGDSMRGFTYLFSALLMAAGLIAFFRRGSYTSLLFSAAVVILLLISASLMHRRIGTLLALGTTLVLAAVMGQRANSSRKVFPAGVVALLSALMTIGYARSLA